MMWVTEGIVDALERLRMMRRPQLLWRLVIIAAGLLSIISLLVVAPAVPVAVIAFVLLLAVAVGPGGHLATAWIGLIGCWLVGAGADAGWLVAVPVTVGALGVHGISAMLATVPGFSVVERRVWRTALVPSGVALAVVGATAVIMLLLGGLTLPPVPLVAGAIVLAAVVGFAAVVWPAPTTDAAVAPGSSAGPAREPEPPRAVSAWARGDEDTRRI